jgi:hypothetical protein
MINEEITTKHYLTEYNIFPTHKHNIDGCLLLMSIENVKLLVKCIFNFEAS